MKLFSALGKNNLEQHTKRRYDRSIDYVIYSTVRFIARKARL